MKKKLFIFLSVAVMLVCALAISVSADTIVPSDSNEYGTPSVVDGIPEPTVISKDAKTVVVVNGKYYTIPTYYLLADNSEFTWSVHANVRSALGLGTDVRGNLVRLEIPEGIETSYVSGSGGKKVESATSLIEASIPTTMRIMGEHFFGKCTALATVKGLENSKVEGILKEAFYNTKITSISLPSTVTTIGANALRGTLITSIVIPDAVESIGDHAFADCTLLATITISENSRLEKFEGQYQFEKVAISSFYFPSSLESLGGGGAFYQCKSLETLVNLENTKITDIPFRTFAGGPKFTTISFPKGLVSIGDNAFNGHKITGDIVLPNTLKTLGDHAFAGSNVTMGKLVLGASLTTITGTYTFEKTDFQAIYIPATAPGFPQGAFKETNGSGVVYYYTGSLEQLNTLLANTNSSDNGNFTNATIVTLEEFEAIDDTSKKNYIIYGLNVCDTFYDGIDYVEGVTDCTQDGICTRCGRVFEGQKTHAKVETLVFPNGLTASGIYTCDCTNEGCTVIDVLVGDEQGRDVVKPLFTAKGYSLSPDKKAINGGYTINHDTLTLYNDVKKTNLVYGIVIANAEKFEGKSFFDESKKVNTTKALQVEINNEYSNFDCSINFGATSNSDLKLIICAYVIDGDNVTFIQAESGEAVDSSLVTGGSFKSVTLDYVAALPTSKEEEIA